MFKHALKSALLLGIFLLGTSACGEKSGQTAAMADQAAPAATAAAQSIWNGDILETMDAGGYTYIHLDTGVEKLWAAAPQTKVAVGQAVSVPKGMLMTAFESKTLGRTFPEIWFVSGIYPEGKVPVPGQGAGGNLGAGGQSSLPAMTPPQGSGGGMAGMGEAHNIVPDAEVEAVAVPAGGYDIAGIYAQSAALRGSQVKVRGRVVKFTANIMGTNWIHIQDGSGKGATADLTVTSNVEVAVGDVILVEGPLAVNKDFGAGYKYAAIIEKATVTVE